MTCHFAGYAGRMKASVMSGAVLYYFVTSDHSDKCERNLRYILKVNYQVS